MDFSVELFTSIDLYRWRGHFTAQFTFSRSFSRSFSRRFSAEALVRALAPAGSGGVVW